MDLTASSPSLSSLFLYFFLPLFAFLLSPSCLCLASPPPPPPGSGHAPYLAVNDRQAARGSVTEVICWYRGQYQPGGRASKGCVEQRGNGMKGVRSVMEGEEEEWGEKRRNELAARSHIKPSASLKGKRTHCQLWKMLKVCLANKHGQVIFELISTPLSVIQSVLLIVYWKFTDWKTSAHNICTQHLFEIII